MVPSFKHERMEGTATCTLTVLDQTNGTDTTKSLQGCIVSSEDENLKEFIAQWKNRKDDQNIFSCHKYFFYSPYHEITTKQAKTTVICYPKNGEPSHHKKQYYLERKVNAVVVDKSHLFLLCESEKLNKSSFLKNHSIKKLGLNQSLGEEIYGLSKIKDLIHCFIKLKIKKCGESSSNEYEVQNHENFEKLLDTGPILVDGQTLVGSFEKLNEESCIISCSVFEITDRTANGLGSRTESDINTESQINSEKIEKDVTDSETDGQNSYTGFNKPKVGGGTPISVTAGQKEPQPCMPDQENVKLQTEKLEKERRLKQFNKELDEENRQLQQQLTEEPKENKIKHKRGNEKLEEEIRQLQQQHFGELKEDKRKLEEDKRKLEEDKRKLEQQNEKLKEEIRQLQQQLTEELKENKIQLTQQIEKLEEEIRQLQQHLTEEPKENKIQLTQQIEKLEEEIRQLQQQHFGELKEDKRKLEEDKRKLEEDKRKLEQQNEKLKEENRQLQRRHTDKLEEDKRKLEQQNEKLKEENRQLQQQLTEELKENKIQLTQQIEKLEEEIRQLQQRHTDKLEEDKRKLEQQNQKLSTVNEENR